MIEVISNSEKIIEELRKEGNVEESPKAEEVQAIVEMNDEMEKVRREYQIKDRNSQISASKVILTA